MKLLMLSVFAVSALAAPQGYQLQEPSGLGLSVNQGTRAGAGHTANVGINVGTGISGSAGIATNSGASTGLGLNTIPGIPTGTDGEINTVLSSGSGLSTGVGADKKFDTECQEGEVRHVDGSCVVPEITRKVFVFSVPKQPQEPIDNIADLPVPKVEHNILFVRLPEGGVGPEPIVVPPPRQENIIYVLNKQGENGQRVIEVPAHPPSEPEIYFVNYEEGENPTLPGGLDLQTALGSAAEADGHFLGSTTAHGVEAGFGNVGTSHAGVDVASGFVTEQTGFQGGLGVNNNGQVPVSTDFNVRNNANVNSGFVAVQTGSQTGFGVSGNNFRGAPSGLYTSP
ncbi:uncharacterized protein LOC122257998 [Penaeus japonicus]|uniref:uncharacterized protein LOC122257998 n=1 Tax=Penaeus japonicus TaxID=27405 RepID=UPI001C70E50B|nr:uncharacterized protein LOC122257998 [Penaeus japonicus]